MAFRSQGARMCQGVVTKCWVGCSAWSDGCTPITIMVTPCLISPVSYAVIVREIQGAVLDLSDYGPINSPCLFLDLNPFRISHELCPTICHGSFIGPFEQVDELGAFVFLGFPRSNYLEVISCHDAHGVISKAVMERLLGAIKYLVDS